MHIGSLHLEQRKPLAPGRKGYKHEVAPEHNAENPGSPRTYSME
jgi:hypothetical protein